MSLTLSDDEVTALGAYIASVATTLETMDRVLATELAARSKADAESLKASLMHLRMQTADLTSRLRLPIRRVH